MAMGAVDEATARIERTDRFAAALIARAPAVKFDLARSATDREAIFRLRYQVVIERGWVAPDAFPTGLEHDTDDSHAVLIGGWDDRRLVAAGRVLFPGPERRMPIERVFDLTLEPGRRVAHLDRLCVARTHRESSHRVFGALLGRCWQEMRANGFSACCGIDSAAMTRVFRRVGLPLIPLGSPRHYWGEHRSPMYFDPAANSATEPAPFQPSQREPDAVVQV
jgi:N-acyl-L-homoserine lactone synthetase